MRYLFTAVWLVATCFASIAHAQKATGVKATKVAVPSASAMAPPALFKEIARADSSLFAAFNTCDSLSYKKFFAEDLEFYHDLGGLAVGRPIEMKSFREMCTRGNHIRRELLKSTLEVYPLKNYGAVEIAVHRFYHTNKGQAEQLSGTYKFIHVWRKKDGAWQITRIISYGHDSINND